LNYESNLIVNEDVVEEILEIAFYEDNKNAFQGEGYSDNREKMQLNQSKELNYLNMMLYH